MFPISCTTQNPIEGESIIKPDEPASDLPKELAAPAKRALLGAGYMRVEQLSQVSEKEIKQLHGIGPNAIHQLRQALEKQGLSFADEGQNKA